MVRDTTEGKASFLNVLFGPMLTRWAEHTTKGREKYADPAPGLPNWTLATGAEEYLRFKDSAFRHMIQWLRGDRDEDHASAVFFNINGAEYVLERCREISPTLGAIPYELTEPTTDEPCDCLDDVPLRPDDIAQVIDSVCSRHGERGVVGICNDDIVKLVFDNGLAEYYYPAQVRRVG